MSKMAKLCCTKIAYFPRNYKLHHFITANLQIYCKDYRLHFFSNCSNKNRKSRYSYKKVTDESKQAKVFQNLTKVQCYVK